MVDINLNTSFSQWNMVKAASCCGNLFLDLMGRWMELSTDSPAKEPVRGCKRLYTRADVHCPLIQPPLIYKARTTMEWMRLKPILVIKWPSQSPDLNPIEADCENCGPQSLPIQSDSVWVFLAKMNEHLSKQSVSRCAKLVDKYSRKAVVAAKWLLLYYWKQ